MATYKLIQDIEAEDHILGPLTLRQFIFALIAVFFFYISFIVFTKGAPFLLVIFLPPALFFGFFAIPFGRDQPTEIWFLAKIRFLIKPRRRIWDQSGIKDLVTITVPKKIEPVLTDGLSQTEVRSRLRALADTIDSRGWAVKNIDLNTFSPPHPLEQVSSDRLIDPSNIPNNVPNYDIHPSDDMLDEVNNPIAQQFQDMITESDKAYRQELVDELNDVKAARSQQQAARTQGNDYWFMNQPSTAQPGQAMFSGSQVVQPGQPAAANKTPADEAALAAQLRNSSSLRPQSNLRTLRPVSQQPVLPNTSATTGANNANASSPGTPDPAILSLANNNDLNVATLARQAKKAKGEDEPNEVVISLH